MVKTTVDLEKTIVAFVGALKREIIVERVILTGDDADEKDDSEIWLLVISPSFEGKNLLEVSGTLARASMVDIRIMAWGFTPSDLVQVRGRQGGPIFLGMMLNGSREVYSAPATKSDAGGLR